MRLLPLSLVDPAAVEALLDRAFGPDRRMRTAYRLREGIRPIDALSWAMLDDQGEIAASIQAWPVALATDAGDLVPMVLVGPVAVEPAIQRGGLGRAITRATLDAAEGSDVPGTDSLMLVGDPEYYGRWFGFTADRTGRWRLPGPWEPHRLLARGSAVPDVPGLVVARADG